MLVRVADAKCDLRVGLDQRISQISQVLKSVRVVLEILLSDTDACSLLQQSQILSQVVLAEGIGCVARNARQGLDSPEFGLSLALFTPQDCEDVRNQRR